MSDESAAGRKADENQDRGERIAAALEDQFHMCRREADFWLARRRSEKGDISRFDLEGLLHLVRTNAQLAQVIARIDAAKNRKTNTQ